MNVTRLMVALPHAAHSGLALGFFSIDFENQ